MTREDWNKLRVERPDLGLYSLDNISMQLFNDCYSSTTPEELVARITADILSGRYCWERDPFFALEKV